MRFEWKILMTVAALPLMAGCAPVDPGFGEAVHYDAAIQTIDPDPVYPEDSAKPGYFGEKAQKATERYRKGTAKPIRTESTQ